MPSKTFATVLNEFCKLAGFKDVDALARGAKLKIDDYVVSFIQNLDDLPVSLSVFIDLGPVVGDLAQGLQMLMEINFLLSAHGRSTLSLHPQTHNVFLAFRYKLDASASGQHLLDTILGSIAELGHEAAILTAHAA
jgi:hypothetical protein